MPDKAEAIRRKKEPRALGLEPRRGSRGGERWPQRKWTFIWGPGEVTYPPEVGRRVVYMLFAKVVCPGGHLRRQEGGATLKVSRGDGSPTFCSPLGQTVCRSCVYLCRTITSGSVLVSQETTWMPPDTSPSSFEEQSFKTGEMGVPKRSG